MTPEQITLMIVTMLHIEQLLVFFIGLMLVLISFIFIREIYKWFLSLLSGI